MSVLMRGSQQLGLQCLNTNNVYCSRALLGSFGTVPGDNESFQTNVVVPAEFFQRQSTAASSDWRVLGNNVRDACAKPIYLGLTVVQIPSDWAFARQNFKQLRSFGTDHLWRQHYRVHFAPMQPLEIKAS